jgi:hypothetical protein
MNDIFLIQGSTLTDTADTIRKHIGGGGISPEDFPEKIGEVYDEGYDKGYDEGKKDAEPNLQDKTITSNGKHTADSGYDGLGTVTVNVNDAPELQEKTVTPNTQAQTVTPDSKYDGLSKVTVNAVPLQTKSITANGTYTPAADKLGFSSVTVNVNDAPKLEEKYITPKTYQQKVTPNSGFDGLSTVYVEGDPDLQSGNIKTGVTIFGVAGNYTGEGCDHTTVERATTTIEVAASEDTDTLSVHAVNNQGPGLVEADEEKDGAWTLIKLYDNGNTVTAMATDGTKVSKSVITAPRAETAVTAVNVENFDGLMKFTVENNQATGWVEGSNKTVDIEVQLTANGDTVTAKSNCSNETTELAVHHAALSAPGVFVDNGGQVTASITQGESGWIDESDYNDTHYQLPELNTNSLKFDYVSVEEGKLNIVYFSHDNYGWVSDSQSITGSINLNKWIDPAYIAVGKSILDVNGTYSVETTVENNSPGADVRVYYDGGEYGLAPGASGIFGNVNRVEVLDNCIVEQIDVGLDEPTTITVAGEIIDYMISESNQEVVDIVQRYNTLEVRQILDDYDLKLAVQYRYNNKVFVNFYHIHTI